MKDANLTALHPLTCPFCAAHQLQYLGHHSARCRSCGGVLSGALLDTLRRITELPDAVGHHACECGHPEMRRLPDGVFWCPACGSEVLPITAAPVTWKHTDRSEAYWSGWLDGRYGPADRSTGNRHLDRLRSPSDRSEYSRGHRDGQRERGQNTRSLEAL